MAPFRRSSHALGSGILGRRQPGVEASTTATQGDSASQQTATQGKRIRQPRRTARGSEQQQARLWMESRLSNVSLAMFLKTPAELGKTRCAVSDFQAQKESPSPGDRAADAAGSNIRVVWRRIAEHKVATPTGAAHLRQSVITLDRAHDPSHLRPPMRPRPTA